VNDPNLREEYKVPRVELQIKEVWVSNSNKYIGLFNEVKDCKSHRRLVKNAVGGQASAKSILVRNSNSDWRKNCKLRRRQSEHSNREFFPLLGEKLGTDLPPTTGNVADCLFSHVTRITSCVPAIDVTGPSTQKSLAKLRANKVSGPDSVAPKLWSPLVT